MATHPNVHLSLRSRAENVPLVRETLTGVAEAIGLDEHDLNDIRTAVTEACNNVVLHAYGEQEGPLEVEVHTAGDTVEVVVRDHGSGIRPLISSAQDSAAGIGVPVIQTLARRVEFRSAQEQGTEVRMEFPAPGARALALPLDTSPLDTSPVVQANTIEVAIAPTSLARTVLPRLLCTLAARGHFSTDRISDTQLVADALVAQTPESIGVSYLDISVSVCPGALDLSIGPLNRDRKRWRIIDSAVAGLSPVVAKLTDRHRVVSTGPSEALLLHMSARDTA
jgi:serine/threonine-protein kinase RsbW